MGRGLIHPEFRPSSSPPSTSSVFIGLSSSVDHFSFLPRLSSTTLSVTYFGNR